MVLRAPHNELERDIRNEWDNHHAAQDRLGPPIDGEQAEYQDAQDEHVQDEACTAADMARVKLTGVLGNKFLSPLVYLDGLMLCAMVGKEAPDIFADSGDPDEVQHKDRDPDRTLD